MSKKHTYKFIKEQFKKEGYTLLSTEYINSRTKLDYICPEGHKGSISWGDFRKGHKCAKCAGNKKHTYKFIKEQFKKEGYKLLSTEYINSHTKLDYICSEGHKGSIKYNDFQQGCRCFECFGSKKYTIEYVKSQFEKEGYKLLSTEYINSYTKLDYICPEGHKGKIRWYSFRQGHRCPECAGVKKYTYEFVKEQFEKEGYQLLSKEYKNANTKLDYICPEGHRGKIIWSSFRQGRRCFICSVENKKGKNCYMWKGGVSELNIPLFDTYAHQIDYCEDVRRDPENKDYLQVRCTNSTCKKWFNPTRNEIKSRIQVVNGKAQGENRFYCSEDCKQSCSIFGQVNYPKGFRDDSQTRPDQKEWAKMVKERDNHICQICGEKGTIAHHIEGLNVNPIMSADIDLGITLCKECDKKVHSEKGCRPIDLTKENCS